MPSSVFTEQRRQMTLDLEEGLTTRFGCLREVVAQGVYQRGLKRMAGDLDMSPGNLSVALSDDPHRKLGVDDLEAYIERTGDKTPIYYLGARFLGDESAARDHALGQVAELLKGLPDMLAAAGIQQGQTRGRAR